MRSFWHSLNHQTKAVLRSFTIVIFDCMTEMHFSESFYAAAKSILDSNGFLLHWIAVC
jgi:hypothetical protein